MILVWLWWISTSVCITYLIIDLCPILLLIAILQSQKSCRLFLQLAIKYIIYTSADHLPWDTQLSHYDHIMCLLAQNRKGSLISRGCLIWRDTGARPPFLALNGSLSGPVRYRLPTRTCLKERATRYVAPREINVDTRVSTITRWGRQ